MTHNHAVRVAAALGVAGMLTLSAPSAAQATLPGRNGRIAFTSNLNGTGWQLYTMNLGGTDVRQVTDIAGSTDITLFQNWAPDGRQLAYSSSRSGSPDLYTVNADGTGTRQITSGPAEDYAPSWSPDGRQLLFARVTNGETAALYRINADGTHLLRLTNPSYDSFFPMYTPNGRHILYVSSRGGLVAAVWIMNADGTHQHRLTPAGFEGTPWDVSPDGTRILLGNHQNTQLPTSLYEMNLNGTGLHRLTNAGCCFHDSNATYSPDGTTIAFTTNRTFAGRGIREDEIWEMTADGRNPHPITSSVTLGGCPDELVDNCVGPLEWSRRSG